MQQEIFERFRSIIYRESGIVLPPEKRQLLVSRIQKRLNALNLENVAEYLRIVELDVSGDELINLIDVVSTNVTHFYREPSHFEILREIAAGWRNERPRCFKLWCAAASSGEEPYTIAFEALEALGAEPLNSLSFKILATDICTPVLRRGLVGVYPDEAVGQIPPMIRHKYMERASREDKPCWKVRREVADRVLFKKLNLVSFPYPLQGPLDVIFCRNVMIYFDLQTRARMINEFTRLLRPGGYLFVSHSENLLGIEHALSKTDASVFRKQPGPL